MRNIEIKSKVRDMVRLLTTVKNFSDSDVEIIPQRDTFYNVQEGRLKLREFQGGNAELIFYKRPDAEGPKLSQYSKCDIVAGNVCGLNNVLTKALGVSNTVKKVRKLFLIGQTRVHLDYVEGLGDFIELEIQGCFKARANLRRWQRNHKYFNGAVGNRKRRFTERFLHRYDAEIISFSSGKFILLNFIIYAF